MSVVLAASTPYAKIGHAAEFVSDHCKQTPDTACIVHDVVQSLRADVGGVSLAALEPRLLLDIVRAEIAAGDLPAAYESAEATKAVDGYDSALVAIAQAEARAGQLDRAAALAERISVVRRGSVWIVMADVHARAGREAEARKLISLAVETYQQMPRGAIRAVSLASAAKAMNRVGQQEDARESLREARAIANELTNETFRSSALGVIASTEADVGDVAAALATARSIRTESFRAIALLATSKAARILRGDEAARGLIEEALSLARNDPYLPSRVETLTQIATAERKIGLPDVADRMASEALGVAEAIDEQYERASALTSVSRYWAQAGDAKRALEMVLTISNERLRTMALLDIAITLAREN